MEQKTDRRDTAAPIAELLASTKNLTETYLNIEYLQLLII